MRRKKIAPLVLLQPLAVTPSARCVEALEELTERARRGEVIAFAAAVQLRNGGTDGCGAFEEASNIEVVIGRLQVCAARLARLL